MYINDKITNLHTFKIHLIYLWKSQCYYLNWTFRNITIYKCLKVLKVNKFYISVLSDALEFSKTILVPSILRVESIYRSHFK